MGRRKTVALLSVLMVAFTAVGGLAAARIAYIGYYDTWTAEDMKGFLEERGAEVTFVTLCDVATTDLSGYDLLIVGYDTGYYGEWGNEAGIASIIAADRPILGIHSGGGSLFDRLGVAISWMATASNDVPGETTIIIENESHPVFSTSVVMGVADGHAIDLYTEPCPTDVLYVPALPADVTTLGRAPSDEGYAPVAIQGKYAFWGFKFPPFDMTLDGRSLFANVVSYLLNLSSRGAIP